MPYPDNWNHQCSNGHGTGAPRKAQDALVSFSEISMRLTKPQMRGLEFFELNERDPVQLMGRNPPAGKTRNWLIRHLYVDCAPIGAFDAKIFKLSDKGRAALRGDNGKAAKTADL
jgi:hypothetical protein